MARRFNGTSDKISFGNSLNISGVALSIYGSVIRNDSTKYVIILTRRTGSTPTTLQYQFTWVSSNEGAGNDNKLRLDFSDGVALKVANSIGVFRDTGLRHDIGVSYNGAFVAFYFDGTLDSVVPLLSSIASLAGLNAFSGFDGVAAFSAASLYNIGAHNVVLAPQEFKLLTRQERILRNMGGYWPIYGTSSTEPDLSGNGINGTPTGTTRAAHPNLQALSLNLDKLPSIRPGGRIARPHFDSSRQTIYSHQL